MITSEITSAARLIKVENGRNARFRVIVLGIALLVLIVLGAIIFTLVDGSMPVFKQLGLSFFTSKEWDPVAGHFGILPAVYGTLVTSFIALIIAVPISFFIAFFLTELCPYRFRATLNAIIELLAGIPSIIYGMWGLFVLAPILSDHVQPVLTKWFQHVWLLKDIFAGPPIGIGFLPAALILAIMIIPFITAVMREVFDVVPKTLKEGGYGLGANRWEVTRDIVLPHTKVALTGGVMLGLGRALGETMAVTFMIGNVNTISIGLFDSGNSIASVIANEFAEAHDLHMSALLALGLILFFIAFLVLAVARALIHKVKKS